MSSFSFHGSGHHRDLHPFPTRRSSDLVYSGVPADMVGRHQEIEVGPMSGESNVVFWLESRRIPATPERIQAVFQDRKSTRLNSSHSSISYAVFCLKKKKNQLHVPGHLD